MIRISAMDPGIHIAGLPSHKRLQTGERFYKILLYGFGLSVSPRR